MIKKYLLVILAVPAIILMLLGSSCNTQKDLVYFSDSTALVLNEKIEPITTKYEPTVQSEDILAINVTSISSITTEKAGTIDPTALYNTGGTNFTLIAGNSSSSSNGGYLVNREGNINFPVLGDIHVAGLKITEVKKLLEQKLQTHLKDPVVEVRISNYKVTLLGQVNHPGQVLAPNHNITILDAIAASGDITNYGRKDNVKIIRETNGNREYATVDLTKSAVLNSPFYYLKQNDIIIVDANNVKKQESNTFTRIWLPITTSLVGLGLGIVNIILLTNK